MSIFQNMALYSLIVSVALGVFWSIWRLTGLKRYTHWHLNRMTLLLITVLSLLIGLIPFVLPEVSGGTTIEVNPVASPTNGVNPDAVTEALVDDGGTTIYVNILKYLVIAYWIGFIVSIAFLAAGIVQVLNIIRKSERSDIVPNLLLSNKKEIVPFSWGSWVVMPTGDYQENGEVILTHELTHLNSKHWLDLLLINLVKAITWYCPFAYLIARDIAENHEFEADDSIIRSGYDAIDYQRYLVERAATRRFANSAVCGINNTYSLIKSRILMMQKSKSSRSSKLRVLGLLPVAVLLAMGATSPMLAKCVQTSEVVNSVKVTEVAIMLSDEELMQPRPEEIQLPKATKEVYKKWSMSLIYPSSLAAERKQGRVILKAKVSTNGEISDVTVFTSSGNKEFDNEAIKGINGTTGLSSATYNGNKADIDCLIPVTFKLQNGPELPSLPTNSGYMLDEIVVISF